MAGRGNFLDAGDDRLVIEHAAQIVGGDIGLLGHHQLGGDADTLQPFFLEIMDPDAAIEDEIANEHPIGRNRRVRTRPAHAQGVGQEPF